MMMIDEGKKNSPQYHTKEEGFLGGGVLRKRRWHFFELMFCVDKMRRERKIWEKNKNLELRTSKREGQMGQKATGSK
jgi:hypothetical protein